MPMMVPYARGAPLTHAPLQRAGTITVPRPGTITVPPMRVTTVPMEGQELPKRLGMRLPATMRQSAATRQALYSRGPGNKGTGGTGAQPSSSATKIEDMDGVEGVADGEDKGKGKAKFVKKIVRAKRYNRKKREEWPPPGWIPIWEEERPRIWGAHEIPDDVPTGEVYDHLKRYFDLKSAGICSWQGCKPADPDNPEYKMLKRHVETVHLGLKLVCQLCGVRKRADNRRKATHKRGCPERLREAAAAGATAAELEAEAEAGPSMSNVMPESAPGERKADGEEEDELVEDEPMGEEGEEGEEDELEEEEVDELEDDEQQEEENEYESEDD